MDLYQPSIICRPGSKLREVPSTRRLERLSQAMLSPAQISLELPVTVGTREPPDDDETCCLGRRKSSLGPVFLAMLGGSTS
jgi:hypothetical protein